MTGQRFVVRGPSKERLWGNSPKKGRFCPVHIHKVQGLCPVQILKVQGCLTMWCVIRKPRNLKPDVLLLGPGSGIPYSNPFFRPLL